MLDEINYTLDNGKVLKEVCHYVYVPNVQLELDAVNAQLADLIAGQENNPTQEAAEVIVNYQNQIKILETFLT